MKRFIALLCMLLLPLTGTIDAAETGWEIMRNRMLEEIRQDTLQARHYIGKDRLSEPVLDAMGRVERHRFVPAELQKQAYGNFPLPIGNDQTISQPFIVALMTDLLEVDSSSSVLEIGTGSGYQAAVLAEIVREVFTIEIVGELAERAHRLLTELGYTNVHVRHGNGLQGWPEEAPFDGIIVTAAGLEVPESLLDQLAPGGHMVIPVGPAFETQYLKVITRDGGSTVTERDVLPVRFVPITTRKR